MAPGVIAMPRARSAWILAVLTVAVSIVATLDTSRAQSGYSTYSVRGVYRISYVGLSVPEGLPESGIGIFVADGLGHIVGTEVINMPGRFCNDVKVIGTYSVDASGLGTMSADFTSPITGCSGSFSLALVVSEGGNLVKGVSTSSRFVVLSEEWRRD